MENIWNLWLKRAKTCKTSVCVRQETENDPLCILGTYNSQYMVVDLSRVSLGHSIKNGALTVVEQIPGKVMHSDQTQALRRGKKQTSIYLFVCSYGFFFSRMAVLGGNVSGQPPP